MKKNNLIRTHNTIYRILDATENEILVIDCIKLTMPNWIDEVTIASHETITDEELCNVTDLCLPDVEDLAPEEKKIVHHRFSVISSIIPCVADFDKRSDEIRRAAVLNNIGKQSIRKYLCLYLAYQNISVLAPRRVIHDKPLTEIEKTMRWGLNKYFYTTNKNSLKEAYTMMIKEKYTDETGKLLANYPTFNQFRYFYRKTRKMQNYYISRNGLKDYQRIILLMIMDWRRPGLAMCG